jgi:hypothetical protein
MRGAWISGVVAGAIAPLSVAWAHHAAPGGEETGFLTSVAVLAGLALLVAALVVVVVAVLTKKRQGDPGPRE